MRIQTQAGAELSPEQNVIIWLFLTAYFIKYLSFSSLSS
jgi:hypothetical protein